MKLRVLIPLGAALILIGSLLMGCVWTKGNKPSAIDFAINTASQKYGIELKLKRKKLLPGGADCYVWCTCTELPGKEVLVYAMDTQHPGHVCCDYIFQKYGDKLGDMAKSAVLKVYPDAKILLYEKCYNHFPAKNYDKNTAFEEYLNDNEYELVAVFSECADEKEAQTYYENIRKALDEQGINIQLGVYCMKDKAAFDRVKTYDHIPEYSEFTYPDTNDTKYTVNDDDKGLPVVKSHQ